VKSAKVLRELGHDVEIVANKDRYKWDKHPKVIKKIPKNADAVIAISASDVKHVLKHSPSKAKKLWWMRGWETWQMPESKLIKRAKSIRVITNAGWLKTRLGMEGVSAEVVYAGMDEWENLELRKPGKIRIGCLYNKRPTKHWDDFVRLSSELGHREYEYVAFGVDKRPSLWLEEYVQNASHQDLEELYSSCHVWFSPSTLEGFHQVPAEANLCGCLVAARHCDSGGTRDYCNSITGITWPTIRYAAQAIQEADFNKIHRMQLVLLTKIGGREANMMRLEEILSGC